MMRILIVFLIGSAPLYAVNPSMPTVTVVIPALVQLSGLSDISLTPTSFASTATGATSACVYTNVLSPLGSYYVTASSLNASSTTFRCKNGTAYVSYNAYWTTVSPAQTVTLASGVKTAQQSGGSSSSLTCDGTPNANFNISLTSAQVVSVAPGVYTDTVTLVISPS